MSQKQRNKANRQKIKDCPPSDQKRVAGVSKTKKIIRTRKNMESQFLEICERIQIDDRKTARSRKQLNQRIAKRK